MIPFDSITITIILSVVSFLAGFIDSIAGGGGLLLLPSLLLAGLPPQVALGTMKFASSIGTGTALINFIMFFQYPIRLRWGKIRGRGFGGNYVFPKI